VAGSDAITDEKQDEELRKKLLRERRNGVHSEQRTNKLYGLWGQIPHKQAKCTQVSALPMIIFYIRGPRRINPPPLRVQ
jgi:hypothetical protein